MPENTTTASGWPVLAACRDEPFTLFFGLPDKYGVDRFAPDDLDRAKAICARCVVREECLETALDWGPDTFGIWGGTTKGERERLRRPIRRAKCPVCGSPSPHENDVIQVCGGCGHSWITLNPTAQARAKSGAAA